MSTLDLGSPRSAARGRGVARASAPAGPGGGRARRRPGRRAAVARRVWRQPRASSAAEPLWAARAGGRPGWGGRAWAAWGGQRRGTRPRRRGGQCQGRRLPGGEQDPPGRHWGEPGRRPARRRTCTAGAAAGAVRILIRRRGYVRPGRGRGHGSLGGGRGRPCARRCCRARPGARTRAAQRPRAVGRAGAGSPLGHEQGFAVAVAVRAQVRPDT